MKKITFVLLLSLFAFVACKTDEPTTEIETIEIDDTELKRVQNDTSIFEILNTVPEKYKDNPEAYIRSQLNANAEDVVDDDCLYFVGNYVFIRPGCIIVSGIPPEFRDCNTTDVIYLACGYNPILSCFICVVEYTIRCDGREFTYTGYDILCNSGGPVPTS